MKKVMVTGGAGYVGSILLRRLLERDCDVVCVDKLLFGGDSILGVWDHPRFSFYKTDITDYDEIDRVLDKEKSDAIVHLAAIVGDSACRLEPELATKINWEASVHLVKRAHELGVKRFVFASTCSNYGKMDDPDAYVTENSPLAPVSLYAELKVKFEKYILEEMERNGGFAPTLLRFATVHGMSRRMRFDLTVNEFTKELVKGNVLEIYGEQFWRPYCHVGDFSRAILAVLHADPELIAYEVFNVGDTNENYTKKMIAQEMLRQIPDGRIKYVQKNEDPRDYRVDFSKIRNTLGFEISRTVPEGIAEVRDIVRLGIIADPEEQRYYNIPH